MSNEEKNVREKTSKVITLKGLDRISKAYLKKIPKEKLEELVKDVGDSTAAVIISNWAWRDKQLSKIPFKDHFFLRKIDLDEMAGLQAGDTYKNSLKTIKDSYLRHVPKKDGSFVDLILMPEIVIDRIAKYYFNLGWDVADVSNKFLTNETINSFTAVLDGLVQEGKLPRQAAERIKNAARIAWKNGLQATKKGVEKNLVQWVEMRLKELRYKPGSKIPKQIREQLAKERKTTIPSITDAISKGKYKRRTIME